MNNGVKQAGFAQTPPPQTAMRTAPRKDAADTAFSDVVQSGDKGSRRSDGADLRWPGADAKFALRPNMLGQAWHNAASTNVDPVADIETPEEDAGLESGAATDRKSFKALLELRTSTRAEGEPEADDKKDDEAADANMALAIVETNPEAGRKNSATTNAGEETVAAAVADAALKKSAARSDGQSEVATDEAAGSGDAESPAGTEKNGKFSSIDSTTPSPRRSSSAAEGQQRSDAQSGRATIEQPGEPARQPTREAPQGELSAAKSRVEVVSSQNLPAPANATTTAFINAISADPVWKTSATDAAIQSTLHGRSQSGAVHSLKIQLHPAELGMVTADLRFAGDQLSVVLQVETAEAYHRLNSDTDTIVKAFRGLGYEIDQVSIQQSQPINQTTRTDTVASNSATLSRDLQSAFSGNSGGAGAGSGGRETYGEGRNDARNADGIGSISQERSSRGLYI